MSISKEEISAIGAQLAFCRQRQQNVDEVMASIQRQGEGLKTQIETLITQAASKATEGELPDVELLKLGEVLSKHAALKLSGYAVSSTSCRVPQGISFSTRNNAASRRGSKNRLFYQTEQRQPSSFQCPLMKPKKCKASGWLLREVVE